MIRLQMQPDGTLTMTIPITSEIFRPEDDDLRSKIKVYLCNQFCARAADLLYRQGPTPMSTNRGFNWNLARILNAYGTLEFFPIKLLYKHRDVLRLIKNHPSKAQDVAEKYDTPCLASEREYINYVLSEAHRVHLMREDEMIGITGPEDLEEYVMLLSSN